MSGDVKHLILTRFNVASPGIEQTIRVRTGWLAGRIKLFETYCLPSVAGQSRQDFEWIVYFDDKTPEEYRQEIIRLQGIYPFRALFTPLFHMPQIVPGILSDIGACTWLLTSRLDSDDVLAVDYVARLREASAERTTRVINFTEGAILSTPGTRARLYRTVDDRNPFAALLEPASPFARTIWGEKHVDINKIAPVRQVFGAPAWLQIVHGGNVSNRVKGSRVPIISLADIFPSVIAKLDKSPESMPAIAFDNFFVTPLRVLREKLRLLVRRIYIL